MKFDNARFIILLIIFGFIASLLFCNKSKAFEIIWNAEQPYQVEKTQGPKEVMFVALKKVEGILDKCDKKKGCTDTQIAEVETVINEVLNIHYMSMMALGRTWKKSTQPQRDEFVDLFSQILKHAYLAKLKDYRGETITILNERSLSTIKAEVETTITRPTGADVNINYRLVNKRYSWKVYDIIIEGISLVKNYRVQFRPILNKKGMDGLLEVLRKKSAYLNGTASLEDVGADIIKAITPQALWEDSKK